MASLLRELLEAIGSGSLMNLLRAEDQEAATAQTPVRIKR